MTVSESISKAANPKGFAVAGVALRPFSIGHWIYLVDANVSFASGSNSHSLDDLLMSVLICSEDFDGFASSIKTINLKRLTRSWHWKLSGGLRGWLRRKARRLLGKVSHMDEISGLCFARECEVFEHYLAYHGACNRLDNNWAMPFIRPVKDTGKIDSEIPEPVMLLNSLTSQLGWSREEALDRPITFARWQWATYLERGGHGKLVDMEEELSDKNQADSFADRIYREIGIGNEVTQ